MRLLLFWQAIDRSVLPVASMASMFSVQSGLLSIYRRYSVSYEATLHQSSSKLTYDFDLVVFPVSTQTQNRAQFLAFFHGLREVFSLLDLHRSSSAGSRWVCRDGCSTDRIHLLSNLGPQHEIADKLRAEH